MPDGVRRHLSPPLRTRRAGRTALVAVCVVGLALAGALPATAAAPPPTRPATASTATAASPFASGPGSVIQNVPLPTGDLVRLSTDATGHQAAAVTARDRHGAAGAFITQRRGADTYVIPATAMPYVDRSLDPTLFNVSQLARSGLRSGPAVRIPVQLTYQPGVPHGPVLGVTITSASGDSATGYLTPAGTRQFGAALADQFQADSDAGWPTDRLLFGMLTGVQFAGAPAAAESVGPLFVMYTLRITVKDERGKPLPFGFVSLLNVDDARKYAGFVFVSDGEARVSVPTGNYSLLADSFSVDRDGTFAIRRVNVSDFAVNGPDTTLAVDMRQTTTPVEVHAPLPTTGGVIGTDWIRADEAGFGSVTSGFSADEGTPILVAPGLPAQVGQLGWVVSATLFSPESAPAPYTYDLEYGFEGAIPAEQRFFAQPGDLATLNTRYYTDVQGRTGDSGRFGFFPFQSFASTIVVPFPQPLERTEYVLGDPRLIWLQFVDAYLDLDTFTFGGSFFDAFRQYRGGDVQTVEWLRPPLRPGFDYDTGASSFYFCPTCRKGNTLGIFLTPVTDSVPGHYGYLDYPDGSVVSSTRWRLYSGGTLLADEQDVTGVPVELPAATRPYRLVFDEVREAPWFRQGTRSHTEWTFRSQAPTADSVPPSWVCFGESGSCAVTPLLTVGFDLRTDLTSRAPAGAARITVDIGRVQGAPVIPVANAAVDVSFDDGATWTRAAVTSLGGGRYDAAFSTPAAADVTLRVRARDTGGNTVDQTIVRAYTVGGAA